MIVFDASGSMSGNGWGYGSETAGMVSRIDKVRASLAKILPSVTRHRRVGLITYGPGVWNQCNVHLDLAPEANSTDRIMAAINALVPAGKTPLTAAVAQAAEVLDFRSKPGLIVLLTDGEETCGGSPCALGKKLSGEARRSRSTSSASASKATPGWASKACSKRNAWPSGMAVSTSPSRPRTSCARLSRRRSVARW